MWEKRNAIKILMESLKGRNYLGDVDMSGRIILSRISDWTLIGFIEHLQLITTKNYNAIASSRTCLLITGLAKSFCLHQSLPGNGSQ
jgi:hypothetical protein